MFFLYTSLIGLTLMSIGLVFSVVFGILTTKTLSTVNPLLKSYLEMTLLDDPSVGIEHLIHRSGEFLEKSVDKIPMYYASLAVSVVATVLGLIIFSIGLTGQVWMLSIS